MPTRRAPAVRRRGGRSAKAARAVSGARTATAMVRPVKPWTRPTPRPLLRATTIEWGPSGIALAEELGDFAVGEPVGRQQMLGHVRVEAGAEDPEVAFGDEGQRGRQERKNGDRGAGPQRLPRPFNPTAQEEHRCEREHEDRERGDRPLTRQPHRPPANGAEQGQPHRGRQPRPAALPAERDRRLPDSQRGGANRQHGCIGAEHVMGVTGLEPVTSTLSRWRSPN